MELQSPVLLLTNMFNYDLTFWALYFEVRHPEIWRQMKNDINELDHLTDRAEVAEVWQKCDHMKEKPWKGEWRRKKINEEKNPAKERRKS